MPQTASYSLRSVVPTELGRCDGAKSFLQSGFWGSFKARFGWNARSFLVDWGEGGKLPLLVIRRRLGPGVSFAYVPLGPELPAQFPDSQEERNQALLDLAQALRDALPHDTAFIRFDPPWFTIGEYAVPPLITGPFVRSGADVQPPDTVIIDVSKSTEEILASMKPKWRYNIKLAGKKGVTVIRMDEAGLDLFYELYKTTARRDKIAIHGINYYKTLFEHGKEYRDGSQDLRLYVATHEGDALAAIIVLFRGEEATYLYGASSDVKRNLMAPYALQWKAIQDAHENGCLRYDLFGIPPEENPRHPMAGLYRFKTGFGGQIIHRSGSWDYAYKPLITNMFRYAESFRKNIRSFRKALRALSRGQ
ncbi:peptidoglycan bridge formation glycyltransferase FemA/FemB family protein [Gracilinema caldarium]|uniref:lipid II:glycine glycyltransferase FemX n=1 Tax=Gracilinema caldarium TaxID=215591 RepID=UPI0026F3137D|nr:peptidoglycan bridge formation glycyltransferase FemA/FemB family protein [Gracilinema caldarium]